MVFTKDFTPTVKTDSGLVSSNNTRVLNNDINEDVTPFNREEIILHVEDFEGDVSGWNTGDGWSLSTESFASETHSMHSPDNNDTGLYTSYDLFSNTISLPEFGEGEIMQYKFQVHCDMPDYTQEDDPTTTDDESGYLADYWALSIMDVAALSWHTDSYNSFDGSSWWCGDEAVGGYLDSWVQYLDTPTFSVPTSASLSADMRWGIEDPAGAVIAGTCTDGWDQANVQISTDGGTTFEVLNGSDPYDFQCGYGTIYNGFDGLPGWGGIEGWHNVSFDLSAYEGEEVIVRFAFYSDPAYSTIDDPAIDGFQVDNILVTGGAFADSGDSDDTMNVSGAVGRSVLRVW